MKYVGKVNSTNSQFNPGNKISTDNTAKRKLDHFHLLQKDDICIKGEIDKNSVVY